MEQSKIINKSCYVAGIRIDSSTYDSATDQIKNLAKSEKGFFICIGNAHVVAEAGKNPDFKKIINSAELVTSDGLPLLWALKLFGAKKSRRVTGTTLTFYLCKMAEKFNIPIGFYGGKEETLELLVRELKTKFPSLNIAYSFSPPFRDLNDQEDMKIVREIKASGAKIIFVGLGCPKQEKWAANNKDRIPAVIVTIGAAFDFISGTLKRAPEWMQNLGLEWFFRFAQEPRRLWKRYLVGNTIFIYILLKEILRTKIFKFNHTGEAIK